MRLVFRADASATIGHGHVIRCLALAEAMSVRGARSSFLCRSGGDGARQAIVAAGHELVVLDAADQASDALASLGALAGQARPDWLIVDHYRLDASWEAALRPAAGALMAIDDLADRAHACDALLDQNWHDEPAERYRNLLPAGCTTLFGPQWALLRPEFSTAAPRARGGAIRRILICFGGGDAPDATGQVLKILQGAAEGLELDVVVGAGNPHVATLRQLCAGLPNACLTVAAPDMARRMAAADLFIGAGGSMTWERACLGLPGITLAIAENQLELSQRIAAAGEGLDLGMLSAASLACLPAALRAICSSPERLQQMSAALIRRCDGKGAARVAEQLYSLRAS